MGDFSIYITKVAIMLSLLFSVYKLTAGRLKCASLQRAILLAIYPISLLSPFLRQEWLKTSADKPVDNFDWTTVATITNNMDASSSELSPIVDVVVFLMVGGSVIGAILFLIGISRIVRCHLAGKSCLIGNTRVTVVSSPVISPFSFGGRIFLSETDYEAQNEMIIAHESSHIRHNHYIDLLLGRCIAIIQWWNPLAWLMLREMHDVHEFQADNDVISQGYDARNYQYLLLREAIGPQFQHIADGFNRSRLKIRLLMINRNESKSSIRLLSLLCIPAAIAGILGISSASFANFINPLARAFESNGKQEEISDVTITSISLSQTTDKADKKPIPMDITEDIISAGNSSIGNTGKSRTIKQDQTITTKENTPDPIEDVSPTTVATSNQNEPISTASDKKIKTIGTGTIKKYPYSTSMPYQPSQNVITLKGTDDGTVSPEFMIDGKLVSQESLSALNPSRIKSISVFKDPDKHPNGLVVVELLTPEEIANSENLKEEI